MPGDAILVSITRDTEFIIPHGNTVLLPWDRILCLTQDDTLHLLTDAWGLTANDRAGTAAHGADHPAQGPGRALQLGRYPGLFCAPFCVLAEPVCRVYFCPVGGLPGAVGSGPAAMPHCSRAQALTVQAASPSVAAGGSPPGRDRRVGPAHAASVAGRVQRAGGARPGRTAVPAGLDALQAHALTAVLMEETP